MKRKEEAEASPGLPERSFAEEGSARPTPTKVNATKIGHWLGGVEGTTAGPWTMKTPAHDYSRCQQFWQRLIALQFMRTDVPAPGSGQMVSGYRGFRELM